MGKTVTRLDWFTGMGMDRELRELTLDWVRQKGVVGPDGEHMTKRHLDGIAAVYYRRIVAVEYEEPMEKRRRMTN